MASEEILKRIIASAVKDEAHSDHYIVPSVSDARRKYRVTATGCSCKGFEIRGECKHSEALSLLCEPMKEVEAAAKRVRVLKGELLAIMNR